MRPAGVRSNRAMGAGTAESFVGAWKLVSVEDRGPDGGVVYPYGPDPAGLLVYEAAGHMSVQIMRRDRVALSGNVKEAGPDELKAAVEGFTSFFGVYEVDSDRGTVDHVVEGHLIPNSVGKVLRRTFEFQGDRLILRPGATRAVTWERITSRGE